MASSPSIYTSFFNEFLFIQKKKTILNPERRQFVAVRGTFRPAGVSVKDVRNQTSKELQLGIKQLVMDAGGMTHT